MNDLNYLQDLEIDGNNIDNIVDTHAVTSMRYHELYAEKLEQLNEQKRKVKITEAELKEEYAKIYIQNKKSGEKITEKENESLILTNPEYKKIQEKYFAELKEQNSLDKDYNVMEGVVKNMQARKNMIESKIVLIQMGLSSIKQNKTSDKLHNKLNKGE